MPSVSKDTATHTEELGVMTGHYGELDGYMVGFENFHEDADATPLFKGLPDDRCQSPHWGYVISGQVTFRFADRDEVYSAGEAYYAPPGNPGDRRRDRGGRVQPRRGLREDDGGRRPQPGGH